MEFIDLKSQYLASRDLINDRIQAVLDHGQYIMGPEVAELEARLAAWTGARHCITVSSGTEALVIALMALGIKAGDEVITTPFSFIATAEAVVLVGATPVFADVEAATGNIDARLVAERITPRTRAIIPVSLYGQPADMDTLNALAEPYGIAVIEDAAQSFGATYRGRRSCNLSTIGCTSFFPSKPLGCYGDGGAVFTSDDALAQAMREIRVHGQSHRYVHRRIGVGGRMDTLQCAVVLAKLERFEWELEQRRRAAADYDALLRHEVPAFAVRPERGSTYAQYTVLVEERERVRATLDAAGIPTAVHYPVPIHRQAPYAHLAAGTGYPVADGLARRVLSLPMGPFLDSASARRVAATLLDACRAAGAIGRAPVSHPSAMGGCSGAADRVDASAAIAPRAVSRTAAGIPVAHPVAATVGSVLGAPVGAVVDHAACARAMTADRGAGVNAADAVGQPAALRAQCGSARPAAPPGKPTSAVAVEDGSPPDGAHGGVAHAAHGLGPAAVPMSRHAP